MRSLFSLILGSLIVMSLVSLASTTSEKQRDELNRLKVQALRMFRAMNPDCEGGIQGSPDYTVDTLSTVKNYGSYQETFTYILVNCNTTGTAPGALFVTRSNSDKITHVPLAQARFTEQKKLVGFTSSPFGYQLQLTQPKKLMKNENACLQANYRIGSTITSITYLLNEDQAILVSSITASGAWKSSVNHACSAN